MGFDDIILIRNVERANGQQEEAEQAWVETELPGAEACLADGTARGIGPAAGKRERSHRPIARTEIAAPWVRYLSTQACAATSATIAQIDGRYHQPTGQGHP